MATFVPNTQTEQQEMLREIGCERFEDLFSGVPENVKLPGALDLPGGISEMEAVRHMEELAGQNRIYRSIFRGAGAYDHFIPSIVGRVVRKEKFLTAYTPYQAEISQGVLQSIFEYQSMICRLTGLDVSNASVYDGASAAAEGAMMCTERGRDKILVSATAAPAVREVLATYCRGRGLTLCTIPEKDGATDLEALSQMVQADTACAVLAQPNFFGNLEDMRRAGEILHAGGAKFVLSCDPVSLGILEMPAALGADVAVGEGQGLGMPLAFGGPYLGFMATKKELLRRLPGRIVGETKDAQRNRAFVLTLQAREQHIKREKAGSNICSNQALCALTAAVYLSAMGPEGLAEAARQCTAKAHYLAEALVHAGLEMVYPQRSFFCEFVTCFPERREADGEPSAECRAEELLKKLASCGILGGLPLGGGRILWCATEKNTRADMDRVAEMAKEVCA